VKRQEVLYPDNMKKILYTAFYLLTVQITAAQTYITGNEVVPFDSIASSSYLPMSERIDVDQGYSQQKTLQPNLNKFDSGPVGEFWIYDGMLINLISRTYDNPNDKIDLEQERLASHPEINYLHGTTPDRSVFLDYFNEIKSISNFEVFIDYFKSKNHKYFLIQDNLGRYIIRGQIHCQPTDRVKAQSFIDTLLQSIIFD